MVLLLFVRQVNRIGLQLTLKFYIRMDLAPVLAIIVVMQLCCVQNSMLVVLNCTVFVNCCFDLVHDLIMPSSLLH